MEDTVHTTAPLSGFVFPLNHLETFVLGDLFTAQEDLSVQMHFPKDNIVWCRVETAPSVSCCNQ